MNGATTLRRYGAMLTLVLAIASSAAVSATRAIADPRPASARTAVSQIFHCRLRAVRIGEDISVTFWLNSEIADREWRVRILQDGAVILSTIRRTNPMGNFRVDTITTNLPGRDTFVGKARDRLAGDLCRVELQV